MKKLTKREKLLIYILGCALIGFFGLYFVILPSFRSYQVVNDQAAEAQFTQESMTMAIDGIPSTMQARDEATANLASLKTPFPQKLTNEGLDKLLTQLSLDYSLSPKVLSIQNNGMAGVGTFTAYTSDEQPSAPDSTTTDTTMPTDGTTSTETTDTTASTEMTETTGSAETWTGVVNMELTGTQPNFYRLLDAVAARPDMIISSFAIAPAAATASGSTTTGSASAAKLDGGNISINVTFMVYMMEK
ncbi:MAG: hypothetical protein CVV00_11965 [Firmicutes bacterium HGW-Firmicutes-5]|jgi:hypothetical protein|nr:MAG: hypothetical protein CVV00_11965 [Firmicutes bacterium HGW-Firmicutes-5]